MTSDTLGSPKETVVTMGLLHTPRLTNERFFENKDYTKVLMYTAAACLTILLLVGFVTLPGIGQIKENPHSVSYASVDSQRQQLQKGSLDIKPGPLNRINDPPLLVKETEPDDEGRLLAEEPFPVPLRPEYKMKGGEVVHLEQAGESIPLEQNVCIILPVHDTFGVWALTLGKYLKEELVKLKQNSNFTDGLQIESSNGDYERTKRIAMDSYKNRKFRKFFGFLSDEEFFSVAVWARQSALDGVFISPTAVSPLLDYTIGFYSLQPPSRNLVAAIHDIISPRETILVAEASISVDAFHALMASSGIKIRKVYYFYTSYEMLKIIDELSRIIRKECTTCPILLLAGANSYDIIRECDQRFEATWILPFPIQFDLRPAMRNSEIITIQFRPHHEEKVEFLQPLKFFGLEQSLFQSSLEAIISTDRPSDPTGSYLVLLNSHRVSSFSQKYLGLSGEWLPIYQYDLTENGLSRKLLNDLTVDEEFIESLLGKDIEDCTITSRFISEMTGDLITEKRSANVTISVPTERGAQIHVDCKTKHADLRCPSGEGFCYGVLEDHQFVKNCTEQVEVSVGTSKSCAMRAGVSCKKGSLGCVLRDTCVPGTERHMKFTCQGDLLSD